jgi:hypothetical protein
MHNFFVNKMDDFFEKTTSQHMELLLLKTDRSAAHLSVRLPTCHMIDISSDSWANQKGDRSISSQNG